MGGVGSNSSYGRHGENNAHINISEGNCPERIIALARFTSAICKVFAVIIENLKDISNSMTGGKIDPQST